MPNVNGKKFPYTPAGMKAAKDYAIKTTAKKKPGTPGPIKDAPKKNPIMTTLPSKSSKTRKI